MGVKNNYPYKYIHYFSLLFSGVMITLGLIVDFNPVWYMNGTEKILIYVTPMLLLFFDMKFHLKYLKDKNEKQQLQKRMLQGIFIIYIIALATLLFLGSTFRRGFYERNIWQVEPFSKNHLEYYCNLVPLKSVKMYYKAWKNHSMDLNIIFLNVAGNLLAFAPFGFFIPVLYNHKVKNIISFFFIAAFSSAMVELIQFLTMVGQADIDDVILNTLGAVIVYGFVHIPIIKKTIQKVLPFGKF